MDEKELVQRLKGGDKAAFGALYEKYKNILLRMAYLISGQIFDAEDVVQETFVSAYRGIEERRRVSILALSDLVPYRIPPSEKTRTGNPG